MPWVKFTDDWYDDEAMADATPLAIAMWAVGITWSARNLTDGRIPRSVVRKLLDLEDITMNGANCRADTIAAELVTLGKWAASDRGYTIANYHRYQPTREQVIAQREANAERQRRFKQRHSANGVTNSPSRTRSRKQVLDSSRGNSRAAPPAVDDDEILAAAPAEVWVTYAELMLARQPAGTVKQPVAWKRRTRENANVEHGDTAARWWHDYQLTPGQLAQALVDGTAPRNEYRRKADA